MMKRALAFTLLALFVWCYTAHGTELSNRLYTALGC